MVLTILSGPNINSLNDVGSSMSRGNIGPKSYITYTTLNFMLGRPIYYPKRGLYKMRCPRPLQPQPRFYLSGYTLILNTWLSGNAMASDHTGQYYTKIRMWSISSLRAAPLWVSSKYRIFYEIRENESDRDRCAVPCWNQANIPSGIVQS